MNTEERKSTLINSRTDTIGTEEEYSVEEVPANYSGKKEDPVHYFFDNGRKIEFEKPNIDRLPKIVKETATIVIKDHIDELEQMAEDNPEEFV